MFVHFRQRLSFRNGGKIFWARDEGAFSHVLPVLLGSGWVKRRHVSGGPVSCDAIFNDPSSRSMEEQERAARSQFTKRDLLIRTTRFGLDDGHPRHQHHRRRVEMSGNFIEGRFAIDWRRYFAHLSRTEIDLKDQASQVLPIGARTHFNLTDGDDAAVGYLHSDGIIRKKRGETVTTPAFIIYNDELWSDGPAALSIFGMSGSITYGFSRLLAHRFPNELRFTGSEFVYCEISADNCLIPGCEMVDVSFTGNWNVTVHRGGRAPAIYGPEIRAERAV